MHCKIYNICYRGGGKMKKEKDWKSYLTHLGFEPGTICTPIISLGWTYKPVSRAMELQRLCPNMKTDTINSSRKVGGMGWKEK